MTREELIAEQERLCLVADLIGLNSSRRNLWRGWHRSCQWNRVPKYRLESNIDWIKDQINQKKGTKP